MTKTTVTVLRFNIFLINIIIGGIGPNQVIARSEFEVHCHIYTE